MSGYERILHKRSTALDNEKTSVGDLSVVVKDGSCLLSGQLLVWTLARLPPTTSGTQVDLSGLTRLDTAGAWELLQRQAAGTVLVGLDPAHARLLELVRDVEPATLRERERVPRWREWLEASGRMTVGGIVYLAEMAEYLGRVAAALWHVLRRPASFPLTSLTYHCQETGLRALPIVTVMSFLIGIVVGFQGADQLRRFGAEIYVVDLIAISMLRELGILLTAILVAGRTASSLTASLGTMKMRQEIDAMRTLALNPDLVLILPRVLALVLMLPILGLVSVLSGLLGGAAMSWFELGLSPLSFFARLSDIGVGHAVAGLVKAPVFAVIIGIIGCHAGMQVGEDAASLGRMASSAVVRAIFAVIIVDAGFSVLFARMGL